MYIMFDYDFDPTGVFKTSESDINIIHGFVKGPLEIRYNSDNLICFHVNAGCCTDLHMSIRNRRLSLEVS